MISLQKFFLSGMWSKISIWYLSVIETVFNDMEKEHFHTPIWTHFISSNRHCNIGFILIHTPPPPMVYIYSSCVLGLPLCVSASEMAILWLCLPPGDRILEVLTDSSQMAVKWSKAGLMSDHSHWKQYNCLLNMFAVKFTTSLLFSLRSAFRDGVHRASSRSILYHKSLVLYEVVSQIREHCS